MANLEQRIGNLVAVGMLSYLSINAVIHDKNQKKVHEGQDPDPSCVYATAPSRYYLAAQAPNFANQGLVRELITANRELNSCLDRYQSAARTLVDACFQNHDCSQRYRTNTNEGNVPFTIQLGLDTLSPISLLADPQPITASDVSNTTNKPALSENAVRLMEDRISWTLRKTIADLTMCRNRIDRVRQALASLNSPRQAPNTQALR